MLKTTVELIHKMLISSEKFKKSFFLQIIVVICLLQDNNLVKANSYLNDGKNVLVPKSSQFCEGCYATIDVLIQELAKDEKDIKGPYRMEEKWVELEDHLCDTSKLTKYVFSPPKVVKVSYLK